MRVEVCSFCSRPVYPSKGITFVRNDARSFRFCRSKCEKNFKMKRQPRRVKWTKAHRALRGKEMIVDSSLLLSQFAKKRNVPVKYDRNLVAATINAMERVEEIRQRRERVFTKRRLAGKLARERQREEDRRVVAEGEHLIRKELREMEEQNVPITAEKISGQVLGEERVRQKKKARVLVDGGVEEEMDTSSTLRTNSTTPERGRPLHRTSRAANSLIYLDDEENDYFAQPVEIKRWMIKDDSTSARKHEDGPSTTDPAPGAVRFSLLEHEKDSHKPLACYIHQAKEAAVESGEFGEPEKSEKSEELEVSGSVLLPAFLEAVSSANTSSSEEAESPTALLEEGIARNQGQGQGQVHNQPTELFDDPQDIPLEPLDSASPTTSGSSEEAESPAALFEEMISRSRTVPRAEYRWEEREYSQRQPPSTSLDAASPVNSNTPTERQSSFDSTTTSSKNPERIHCQHLAEKFKELECYQPGRTPFGSLDAASAEPESSTTESNGSAKHEDGDEIFHFELDQKTPSSSPSPSPTPPSSASWSASASASLPFGGFQDENGHWNIDHASTLPFGAKSGRKRRTRRRPRKGRARQKLCEEADGEAETSVDVEGSELLF
ncbi:Ribosome biogenesis protein RLP24 [Talaromyces islandicus]|uniref:Ribosome biogenesis protein RLP24 n=1 Tax=Talaromyces islandicus TaxID=28573 RepID=A0A0U1LRJ8_TALIS|nr:Ribosome biogenesis protein RLP24 [Talaromyces islandicus]